MAEGLNWDFLRGRLRGGGSCRGQGGAGSGWRAVVSAGAFLLLLLPPVFWLLALTLLVVVMVMLLVVVVLVLLVALGLRLQLGVELGSGDRLEVEEDIVSEVRGDPLCRGGGSRLLLGCRERPHGGRSAASGLLCSCGFGFGFCRGLVDKGGGEGRGGRQQG